MNQKINQFKTWIAKVFSQPRKLVFYLLGLVGLLMVLLLVYLLIFAQDQSAINLATENDGKVKVQILDVNSSQSDLPSTEQIVTPVEQNNSLIISTEKPSYQVGDLIIISVEAMLQVVPDGIQFVINYDPTMLADVKLEETNTFGSFVVNSADEEAGRIKAMLLRDPQEEVDLSTLQPIIQITAQTIQEGELNLSFDQQKTKMSAAGGQNVLKEFVDLSVAIND